MPPVEVRIVEIVLGCNGVLVECLVMWVVELQVSQTFKLVDHAVANDLHLRLRRYCRQVVVKYTPPVYLRPMAVYTSFWVEATSQLKLGFCR